MVPSDGSSLSPAFCASRNCDAMTYSTSSARNGKTPRAKAAPRPGCWLINRRTRRGPADSELAFGRRLHVAHVETHLEIRLVAERGAARELDAHHVDRLGALAQQSMVEREFAHQVHFLDQVRAPGGGHRAGRGRIQVGGRELALESGE